MDGKEKEFLDDELPPVEPEEEIEGDESEIDEEEVEAEGEQAATAESQPQAEAQKPAKGSPSYRVQQAVNAAREAKREAEEAKREIARLLQERQAPRQPDPEEERRRLDMMSDAERFEYLLNKQNAAFQTQLQRLSLQVETQTDQAQFQSRVAADPDLKKYAPEVERRFGELMAQGRPQTRESILKYLLGEALLTKRSSALPKARKAGEENIRRAQTRPSSPRSNVSGEMGGRDEADAAYERLVRYAERGGTL